VAIVTGVEGSFCAGADLKDFISKAIAVANDGPIDLNDLADKKVDGISFSVATEGTLRDLPIFKPIIAAVNGVCVAGGMEMVGGTDIVIACPEALFGVTEPRVGLFAGGGTTPRLPRQLPWRAAMEILLTAEMIPAHRALELGLINDVVPRDQLLDRAFEWARRITVNAPLSVQATKESALRGLAAGSLEEAYAIEAEIAARVGRSEDAAEGPRAFMEKRAPVWAGR
jgi:enoyl-CoA hydratase